MPLDEAHELVGCLCILEPSRVIVESKLCKLCESTSVKCCDQVSLFQIKLLLSFHLEGGQVELFHIVFSLATDDAGGERKH